MTALPGIGVFQTEFGANQVPLKLAPPLLTVTVALCVAGVVPLAPLQLNVKVVVTLSAAVLTLPLVGSLPDQPPEAVQLEASVDDQLSIEAEPALTVAGLADKLSVGFDGAGAVTLMSNGASESLFQPSLTEITMFEYTPTLPVEGVPESSPVRLLKVLHVGWLLIEKTNVWPDVSLAEGVKEYI